MNPLFFLSALSGLAAAANKHVRLAVQTPDNDRHTATINFYYADNDYSLGLLSAGAGSYRVNSTDNSIYFHTREHPEYRVMRVHNNALVFKRANSTEDDPAIVRVGEDGHLNVQGDSSHFWQCGPPTWDPTGEPTNRYWIGVSYFTENAPDTCIPIRITTTPI